MRILLWICSLFKPRPTVTRQDKNEVRTLLWRYRVSQKSLQANEGTVPWIDLNTHDENVFIPEFSAWNDWRKPCKPLTEYRVVSYPGHSMSNQHRSQPDPLRIELFFCEIVVPMEILSIPAKFYCFMATRVLRADIQSCQKNSFFSA
jgi:hypothetical protein